jgi:hypothetical protein
MRGTLKGTAATSRHPETAVQRPYAGRGVNTVWKFQASATVGTVVVPLLLAVRVPFLPRRPCASVGPTAPDADMHGRIADGGRPELGLEPQNRSSAA